MTYRKMTYAIAGVFSVAALLGWKVTARGAYETAKFTVIVEQGEFEIREYRPVMMATTATQSAGQGRNGSFMRLFRYISGANEGQQKVAMTTPVFMQSGAGKSPGQMGFVIPKSVEEQGIPRPTAEAVRIRRREGGRYAVVRFAGRMNQQTAEAAERQLRDWMQRRGLESAVSASAETAGYDPPWTPGPLRRNEVLIRLK